jgi:ATP-dependent Clp protease adaptor protein ClpS
MTILIIAVPITTTTPVITNEPVIINDDNYQVVLYNDDFTPFQVVTKALQEVVGLPSEDAYNVMMTAHTTGKAVVVITNYEMAEFYTEQLRSHGLTVDFEKV